MSITTSRKSNFGKSPAATTACIAGCSIGLSRVSVAQVTATPQPSSNDAGMLPEVLVTVQRGRASNENIPISVEAVSAVQLASTGALDFADLATRTPGLVMGSQGGYLTAVNLRRHV